MRTFGRLLASFAAVLTLGAGNLAACTGWDSAPDVRMACCAGDDTCPLHDSTPADSTATTTISQPDAGNCCAMSEGHGSGESAPIFLLSTTLAPASESLPVNRPAFNPALEGWRALVSLPRSTVPKHLLHSVFLV